jgi:two-component system phosphate regulon response regulator PhoB
VLRFGDLSIDPAKYEVKVEGRPVELTAMEFKLLTLLVGRPERLQSRDQLLNDVWGYARMVETRTVDTHIRRLREKLGVAGRHLETVRGIGYRFVA